MNALSLAAERGHNGVGHALPPEGDVAPPPEFPYGSYGRLAQCRAETGSATAPRSSSQAPAPAPTRHALPSALVPAASTAATVTEDEPTVDLVAPLMPVPASTSEPDPPTTAAADNDIGERVSDPEPLGQVIAVDFKARRRRQP